MITFEQIRETAMDIIKEYGSNHVYDNPSSASFCFYENKGQPSCLVAKIMNKLGTDVETLKKWDSEAEGNFVSVVKEFELDIEPKAVEFLGTVQKIQDDGGTWGHAIDFAANGV